MAPRPLDKLLGFLWRRTYYESLSSLITLVELTCSATMLENDSVLIVGSLPMLRRLTIVGPIIPVIPDSDVFSMDSFPALRQLHLAGSHEYANGLARILSISALMSRLTRLELEYWPEDDLSFHPDTMDVLVESGAFEQLRNAPHLRSLAFRVDPEERATPYDIGHLDLMETFSGLSLETIVLTGVKASAWMSDVNRFREVWMNMTRVSMPDQLGSHSVLECFAQLPRLRYLKIKLFLEAAGDYDPEDLSMCLLNTLESSAGGIVPIEPEHLKPLGE
ncbi:hypothetical protein FRC09_004648 [Ceratobasidium sp. 395]|nr:hypothetical protein FRC09_004648 [Ceratobasidium sp. 395]